MESWEVGNGCVCPLKGSWGIHAYHPAGSIPSLALVEFFYYSIQIGSAGPIAWHYYVLQSNMPGTTNRPGSDPQPLLRSPW